MSSLVYPLTVSGNGVQLTDDPVKVVGDAIMSALLTQQTERPYRPSYGYDTQNFKTVSRPTELLATCRQAIDLGLVDYGLVDYSLLVTSTDNGDKVIQVQYQVNGSTNRLTLTV